jgi:hypothetical protein
MKLLLVSTLLILCLPVLGLPCKATQLDFTGRYALGRQEELIFAFDKLEAIIPTLPSTTYRVNEFVSYTIFKAKPKYYYH